ncbi:hypothetical protein TL18_03885 [Methanobrevibacter sp. YE315]|uniref:hypothetical protein n=1 Tax=Methanobrevibacter sp. YE315 TaxID=1609968 RepID=UPI000764D5DB|nr:hypothetical protein [Methanobrevibacter sp. YE315]AMD17238.1 hypothetical protein TL18_03885 [Methanobrevibacter sp. YE315]
MAHPHIKAIESMNASSFIGIIEESKLTYVRDNLDIHLHESQVKLLKQVKKHEKAHHKRIRIKQYEKAEKTDLFKLHEGLYLKSYRKLAKKGLIEIDENPENGLPYDCSLTDYGKEILEEIARLESEWEDVVGITDDDLEVLKTLALNSFEISYNHKKKLDFIF